MAIIETSRPVPFGAEFTLRMVNVFDNLIAGTVEVVKTVKTKRALNKLSNRQLEDIGLTRAEIHNVASRAARA